jgi:hypothetical protein
MRLTGAYSRVITLLGGSMQPLALRGMSSSACLVQGVQDGRPLCALGWRHAQSDWFLPFYIVNSGLGLDFSSCLPDISSCSAVASSTRVGA